MRIATHHVHYFILHVPYISIQEGLVVQVTPPRIFPTPWALQQNPGVPDVFMTTSSGLNIERRLFARLSGTFLATSSRYFSHS